jgi:hypothetical protein
MPFCVKTVGKGWGVLEWVTEEVLGEVGELLCLVFLVYG